MRGDFGFGVDSKKKEQSPRADNKEDDGQTISISELYARLVLQYRLDVKYLLEEMRPLELNILMRNLDYAKRDEWEMTRMMMLASIQPHSRKSLSAEDIMKFRWDDEHKEQAHEPTDDEIQQINKQFEKMLNS